MSSNPQSVIVLTPDGFDQILAQEDETIFWSFPVIYEIQLGAEPAENLHITIGGISTALVFGQPCQMVSGNGNQVSLVCELGQCLGVKIGSNPQNQPTEMNESGCPSGYPLISIFSAQSEQETNVFQIAQVDQSVQWFLGVDLSIAQDPEQPPTSANVSLSVDNSNYATLEQGSNEFTPTGSSLAFMIDQYQGPGGIKLAYRLVRA